MTPLLSIITPVRNTELFLRECINSILAQEFEDWELILVDDGSTDHSPDICKEYSLSDTRIKYLRQSHQGQGIAKNKGISQSEGKYLTFVDSDDTVREDSYRENMGILDENPNLEILQFPITKFFDIPPQTTGGSGPIEIISDTEPLLRGWLMERKISSYFCNKIFRHSVFDGLQFPRGYYEDRYLMSQVLRRVKSVGISGQGCYYYRQHPAQTTRQPNDAEMSRNLLGAEASIVKAIQGYKSLNRVKVDRYLNCLAHAKALGASLWEEEKELLKSIRPSIAEINLLRLKPQLALRCLIWNILSIDRYLKFF